MTTDANDQLAAACRRHPDRFIGMTAIAPQDPAWSAKEIERGRTLGFKAVILNGHVNSEYTDDPKYWPIFEAAEALGTPIYLHPQGPSKGLIGPLLERGLDGAVFGFGVDTGLHLLRLIVMGVFDRFPKLKFIVGHGGEALPYWAYRLDYMHAAGIRSGPLRFLEASAAADFRLLQAQYLRHLLRRRLGARDPVLQVDAGGGSHHVRHGLSLSVPAEEVAAQDAMTMSAQDKKAFFQTNAERVFDL